MMSIEALKLALEALEVATTPLAKDRQEVLRARAAIREALAQPPQRTWVELTPEEIKKAWSQALADTEGEHDLPLNDFASLLQAKLKEKNT